MFTLGFVCFLEGYELKAVTFPRLVYSGPPIIVMKSDFANHFHLISRISEFALWVFHETQNLL